MTRNHLPLISSNPLLWLNGVGEKPVPVVVGTDAWYSWLIDQRIQSFKFSHPLGTFTARRECKRQRWYWYAYRKRMGRLRKFYLGKTEDLTLERLNEAVIVLNNHNTRNNDTQVHLDNSNWSTSCVSSDSIVSNNQFFKSPSFSTHRTDSEQTTMPNLPAQLVPLVGRKQEIEAVCALLRQPDVHLLTLIGTGGVGKTCLALQVANDLIEDFPDGACFVSLATISDPDLVIPTIAEAIGLKEPEDTSLSEILADFLYKKQFLLFLDNFEQVIDAAPALMELLRKCYTLKVLVTSRETLHVRGEQEFPVHPLELPKLSYEFEPEIISQSTAVALFLQKVRSFNPDYQITTSSARTIAEICIHLDGLPLALELAAARLKLLSPQALLERLDHRLQFLTLDSRDAHIRHQTLRNTLQWSYDLLSVQEQRLFQRLAVFAGGFTIRAVEVVCKVCSDEMLNVYDSLLSLLDKSLLVRESTQGDGEPRLKMLETIREYGLDCLTVSGELELIRKSHAKYYLDLVEKLELRTGDSRKSEWLDQLEREHSNLRVAMKWMLEQMRDVQNSDEKREMALRFGVALKRFWVIHGCWNEGRTFLEQVLAASEGTITVMRVKALEVAASLAIIQMDHERAESLLKESLQYYRECGETADVANSLYMLGTIARQKGNFTEARSLMEESLQLAREVNDMYFISSILSDLGGMLAQQGEYAIAYTLLEQSLALSRKLEDAISIARSLPALALMLFISQGELETVCSLLDEGLTISRELGFKGVIARCLSHFGLVALQQGKTAHARLLLEESLTLHKETGDQWGIAWVLSILAEIEACNRYNKKALALYEESLTIARRIGSKLNIARCLEGMANILSLGEYPVRAAYLWGAAEALRESIGAPIWPIERTSYKLAIAATRDLVGEKVLVDAWDEGRLMSLEQVITLQRSATLSIAIPSGHLATSRKKASASFPAKLTRREIDVLRLLAMGLTSAKIAEQLVISLATVNTHVGSIYTKLDITSRSAATRYAVEHNLV